jgi:hypothetical protein
MNSLDGSKLFLLYNQSLAIEYTLSTAWNVTSDWTAGDLLSVGSGLTSINFNDDGSLVYFSGPATVTKYSLSPNWDFDPNTFSLLNAGTIPSPVDDINIATFANSGFEYFVLNQTDNTLYQYLSATDDPDSLPTILWPESFEWEEGYAPRLPGLNENMLIEIEARSDYRGTNYLARLIGRNF